MYPLDHTYLVNVHDGEAFDCSCPANEKYRGKCKHRQAVENNEPVLQAGSASDDEVRAAREGR